MTVKISPARRKMIEVMTLKGLSSATQENYQRTVSVLSRDCGRAPQNLSAEEISAWVISRIDRGLYPRTTNADVSALRLFYNEAMGQPEKVEGLHCRRIPDRLPRSIPEADVELLIEGINDLRYRTATLTAYGAGLRISEVVALHVGDVRGDEGLLHIRSGKGGHERMAHLPDPVLRTLRQYWKNTRPRPRTWLFHGKNPDRPITTDSLRTAFNRSRDRAGLDRGITFHSLRHAVATHVHERGAPISVVQDLLGHKSPDATRVYARTTGTMFRKLDHPMAGFASAV